MDIPLTHVLDAHNLNDNSMTVVLKELDLGQKAKFKGGEVAETYDIFGLAEFTGGKAEER